MGFLREFSSLEFTSTNFSSVSTQHFDWINFIHQSPSLSKCIYDCMASFLFDRITPWNLRQHLFLLCFCMCIPHERRFQCVTLTWNFETKSIMSGCLIWEQRFGINANKNITRKFLSQQLLKHLLRNNLTRNCNVHTLMSVDYTPPECI
jgi:hypothetical protein